MKYIRHYLKGLNMEKYGKQLRQAEEEETGSERAITTMGNNQRGIKTKKTHEQQREDKTGEIMETHSKANPNS